jgi:hypothetical protein
MCYSLRLLVCTFLRADTALIKADSSTNLACERVFVDRVCVSATLGV